MAETVVDLSNITSVDNQGDPDNTTLIVDVPDNSVITGISWDVTIQTFDFSFLSEARISFDNSSDLLSPEFTLQPGTGGSGTQSFSGSVSDSVPILDGNLYLEFWESFEDLSDDTDAIYLPGSSLTIMTDVGDDITGTPDDDFLTGTAANDFLDGLDGDDTLNGSGGNDTLQGGDGDDNVYGGTGDDTLRGNSGNDLMTGADGNDTLRGSRGMDTLNGSAGDDEIDGGSHDDTVRGGAGNDLVEGGSGNDSVLGGTGDDSLRGGSGNDLLKGGSGNDTLRGANGHDTLTGGLGDDELTGGRGRDTFVLAVGEGTDTITDFDSHDVIGLADGLMFADLTFIGNDILSGGEILATISGVDTTTLSADDFTDI